MRRIVASAETTPRPIPVRPMSAVVPGTKRLEADLGTYDRPQIGRRRVSDLDVDCDAVDVGHDGAPRCSPQAQAECGIEYRTCLLETCSMDIFPTSSHASFRPKEPTIDRQFGKRVRSLQRRRGFTQESLAENAEPTRDVPGKQRGKRNVTPANILALGRARRSPCLALEPDGLRFGRSADLCDEGPSI